MADAIVLEEQPSEEETITLLFQSLEALAPPDFKDKVREVCGEALTEVGKLRKKIDACWTALESVGKGIGPRQHQDGDGVAE